MWRHIDLSGGIATYDVYRIETPIVELSKNYKVARGY